MWASDSNIQQVAYIAASHIQKLRNSSANSFTSGRPGEDSTSSTLLRKVCVEEKGHHGTVASHTGGHSVCVCLLDCTYETCVRLLAVLWGMVLLGSSFRKPNTGMGPGSLELWTSSKGRMTKGRLTSEAVWGDNKSRPKPRRLSWEGCSSRIAHSPSLENTPIMVLLYGSMTRAAVSTFLCLFVSFLHPRLFKNRKSIHACSQYSFSQAPPVHPKTSGSRSDHKEFWIPIIISHWPFHVKDRQQTNILFIALKETQQMTISC